MTPIIHKSITRMWQWLLRAHHNGGHGIHSPFVFRMIEFVTTRHTSYYRLEALLASLAVTPTEHNTLALLYRVVAYLKPSNIITLGTVPSSHQLFAHTALSTEQHRGNLYLVEAITDLHFVPQPKDILVVTNAYYNKTQHSTAKKLIHSTNPRTVIDFTDVVILLFDPALHSQHYRLNP